MFDRQRFNQLVLAEAKGRYMLTDEQRARIDTIAGPLSKEDDAYFKEMAAHFVVLQKRVSELFAEIGNWERDDFDPDELSMGARALFEVFGDGGDDAKAFDLAPHLPELDADVVIFAVLFDDDMARDRRDALPFAISFAEEKASFEMKREIVRNAITCGFEDPDGTIAKKLQALIGRPFSDAELDTNFFQGFGCIFHDSGMPMGDALKSLFALGGSEAQMRLSAAALLDWNDEEDGCAFADVITFLPSVKK